MTHLFRYGASYSAQFQAMMEVMLHVSGENRPHLTSLFYRVGDTDPADAGARHDGVDFNYNGNVALNVAGASRKMGSGLAMKHPLAIPATVH